MSIGAFVLNVRAHRTGLPGARSGVKKAAKTALARTARRAATQRIVAEINDLASPESLKTLDAGDLELYADWLLDDFPESDADLDGSEDAELNVHCDEEPEGLPNILLGSLPDWMLSKLEEANGDAFEMLSLFEAKSLSPKAAISMEDEAQYA